MADGPVVELGAAGCPRQHEHELRDGCPAECQALPARARPGEAVEPDEREQRERERVGVGQPDPVREEEAEERHGVADRDGWPAQGEERADTEVDGGSHGRAERPAHRFADRTQETVVEREPVLIRADRGVRTAGEAPLEERPRGPDRDGREEEHADRRAHDTRFAPLVDRDEERRREPEGRRVDERHGIAEERGGQHQPGDEAADGVGARHEPHESVEGDHEEHQREEPAEVLRRLEPQRGHRDQRQHEPGHQQHRHLAPDESHDHELHRGTGAAAR